MKELNVLVGNKEMIDIGEHCFYGTKAARVIAITNGRLVLRLDEDRSIVKNVQKEEVFREKPQVH